VLLPKVYSLPRACRPLAVALASLALSGCAISTQLGPIFGGGDDQTTTGSITPRDKRFSNAMTDEDWAHARAALDVALAERPAAEPAQWDNPRSGLRGTVAPVASAYQADDGTCHAFVASLVEGTDTHWYQGRACRAGEERWRVVDTAQWMPPMPG
jgi:surface antigen